MADIKKKKITDLPSASSIEGLLTLGVDNTGNSVKVSIEQLKGNEGATPYIGVNGNWWVGTVDTGVKAQGDPGEVSREELEQYAKTETEKGIVVRSEDGKIPINVIFDASSFSSNYNLTFEEAVNIVPVTSRKTGIILRFSQLKKRLPLNSFSPIPNEFVKLNTAFNSTTGALTANPSSDILWGFPITPGVTYTIKADNTQRPDGKWSQSFSFWNTLTSARLRATSSNPYDSTQYTFTALENENFLSIILRVNGSDFAQSIIPSLKYSTSEPGYEYEYFEYEYIGHDLLGWKMNDNWHELSIHPNKDGVIDNIGGYPLVSEKNNISGKRISFLGDSITTFKDHIPSGNAYIYPYGDVLNVDQTWWHKLVSELKLEIGINESWSGSRIATGGSMNTFTSLTRLDNIIESKPDILIIFGGINDWRQTTPSKTPIGEFLMSTTVEKDKTQFKQAYQFILEYIQPLLPNTHIFLMPMFQRREGDGSPDMLSGNTADIAWSQWDMYQAIKQLASMYAVNFIDTWSGSANWSSGNTYTIDGSHPNVEGMIVLKNIVKDALSKLF